MLWPAFPISRPISIMGGRKEWSTSFFPASCIIIRYVEEYYYRGVAKACYYPTITVMQPLHKNTTHNRDTLRSYTCRALRVTLYYMHKSNQSCILLKTQHYEGTTMNIKHDPQARESLIIRGVLISGAGYGWELGHCCIVIMLVTKVMNITYLLCILFVNSLNVIRVTFVTSHCVALSASVTVSVHV